ncbi:uncharacterized protein KY384_000618 [Bacidia gigantensis]|uniref:uncharacterized protein n=1 Tax=Bacidia gigantensis TaxID=2732470 RepID=UPI001D0535D9|nr:uncharacterized protein KY384_000618 [Bacidia gigantensis]KAG8525858.1 hypothetical protein KY384_000618 [Bacidia gigantensis]
MTKAGVPCVPGYHGSDQGPEVLEAEAEQIGFPVMLKAVKGGGGKGMRIALTSDVFQQQLESAKSEATSSFGDDTMLVEKYISTPRHIEVQIFADKHGNCVALGERDCSIQRRHQKVLEESPAPNLDQSVRQDLWTKARAAALAVGYEGAGTVEFIFDTDTGKAFFMEMNTRLQVEHPVTEMVTGEDLVRWQIMVAEGQPLPLTQPDIEQKIGQMGHAIEARIYAEKPAMDFIPDSGVLAHLAIPPTSDTVRVDAGFVEGDVISAHYDPMIAKLIVRGPTREVAVRKLQNALEQYQVGGVVTNIEFLKRVCNNQVFLAGNVETGFISKQKESLFSENYVSDETYAQAALASLFSDASQNHAAPDLVTCLQSGFGSNLQHRRFGFVVSTKDGLTAGNQVLVDVRAVGPHLFDIDVGKRPFQSVASEWKPSLQTITSYFPSRRIDSKIYDGNGRLTIFQQGQQFHLQRLKPAWLEKALGVKDTTHSVLAPMPCRILRVVAHSGEEVEKNQPLIIIESMKMETIIRSPQQGIISRIVHQAGVIEFFYLKDLALKLLKEGPHKIEKTPRRVRGLFDGDYVFDTTQASHVWEHPFYPQFYVPASAFRGGTLIKGSAVNDELSAFLSALRGNNRSTDRVLSFEKGPLAGLVRVEAGAIDAWFEEDARIYGHPKDPYKRIDILPSGRKVTVKLDGIVIAESNSNMFLYETLLRPRYYLSPSSVGVVQHKAQLNANTPRRIFNISDRVKRLLYVHIKEQRIVSLLSPFQTVSNLDSDYDVVVNGKEHKTTGQSAVSRLWTPAQICQLHLSPLRRAAAIPKPRSIHNSSKRKAHPALAEVLEEDPLHPPDSSNPALSFPCLDASEAKTAYLNNRSLSSGPEPSYTTGKHRSWRNHEPLMLDWGGVLPEFDVAFETWGTLNKDRSNAIMLHTGLSASSHAHSTEVNPKPGWWETFIGPGAPLDTSKYFVICTNVIGGCYGSTGPSSIDPADGEPYATRFPILTMEDMVRAQFRLMDAFGIRTLYASVGCSMGGMQSLAAGVLYPRRVGKIVSRQVLMMDPNWKRGFYYDSIPPHAGMKLAREIATITYRSGPEWEQRFGRTRADPSRPPALCPDFLIETYLDHAGEKFCLEYDANSLLYVSKAMDLFDLGRKHQEKMVELRKVNQARFTANIRREGAQSCNLTLPEIPYEEQDKISSSFSEPVSGTSTEPPVDLVAGLRPLKDHPTLVMGVASDILFPAWQQREIAETLRATGNRAVTHIELGEDTSLFGHDTFLLDLEHVGGSIRTFLG